MQEFVRMPPFTQVTSWKNSLHVPLTPRTFTTLVDLQEKTKEHTSIDSLVVYLWNRLITLTQKIGIIHSFWRNILAVVIGARCKFFTGARKTIVTILLSLSIT